MTESSKFFDGERVIHEVDGIMECDNRLPRWWLYTLFGSVIFSAFYWLGYHSFGVIDSTQVAFDKAKEAKAEADAQKLKTLGEVTNESLLLMSKNEAITMSGRATFVANCVTCHGENAQGNVGPNLTDSYWLHGGKPTNIYRTVHDGWPDKGMKIVDRRPRRRKTARGCLLRHLDSKHQRARQGTARRPRTPQLSAVRRA